MSWPETWTDAEFDGKIKELDLFLDRHLGHKSSNDLLDADFVLMPLWLPSADLGAMNQIRERANLLKFQSLAAQTASAWAALHPDIRAQIVLLSATVFQAEGKHAGHLSKSSLNMGLVAVLDGLVKATDPVANQTIDEAPQAGRRDLVSVAVVERLRMVWTQRTESPAPKSMTEAGAFADFMFEAFSVIGLRANARAAMDSWREFRAKWPSSR